MTDTRSELEALALSPNAIEMLAQLYAYGPTWDGNVATKVGRGELVHAGLAFHAHGYASLTSEGVRVASEWDINWLFHSGYRAWYEKRKRS